MDELGATMCWANALLHLQVSFFRMGNTLSWSQTLIAQVTGVDFSV